MASSDTHGAVRVDPGNEGALAAWDGPDGAYWARYADHFDRSVTPHTEALMGAAAIATGERVLDVGCGSGQTTRRAAQAATGGSAVGIDLSREMLAVARSRAIAEGLTNVEFVQGDAQVHPFEPGAFDVVISRTGAMFFADPVAAFGNIGRGMADGGRLALLVWQGAERNEWIASFLGAVAAGRDLPTPPPGAPGPFSL
ncbi:MAG TPA: class I SAM-dependent methyltransferase, partial [Acidimicrobiia bacterium]|nr:class I SAM-dependent methyltransferase [Acidimicrobiia bacterium]